MHGGVYFHSRPIQFENGACLIYKTNLDVYKTANMVDALCSAFTLYSTYKAGSNALLFSTFFAW